MTTGGVPQMLISRHVTRLAELWEPEKIDELLDRLGLTRVSGIVEKKDGGLFTMNDCFQYKQALGEIFDDQAFEFARVNFILGGCKCPICNPSSSRSATSTVQPAP